MASWGQQGHQLILFSEQVFLCAYFLKINIADAVYFKNKKFGVGLFVGQTLEKQEWHYYLTANMVAINNASTPTTDKIISKRSELVFALHFSSLHMMPWNELLLLLLPIVFINWIRTDELVVIIALNSWSHTTASFTLPVIRTIKGTEDETSTFTYISFIKENHWNSAICHYCVIFQIHSICEHVSLNYLCFDFQNNKANSKWIH